MLGHVGNETWLVWVNWIAQLHSQHAGLDMDAYRRMGAVWIVRRHEIDYVREAREGQGLEFFTWVSEARAASSTRCTVIRKEADVAVSARTQWAFVDWATRRPRRIPDGLLERYGWDPARDEARLGAPRSEGEP